MKRRIIPLLLAAMMALAVTAPPAFATEKCNAGKGNGGEYSYHNECDPGNSGYHNNAGDTD